MAGTDLLRNGFLLTFSVLLFTTNVVALEEQQRKVTFVNELPGGTPIELYWENHETGDRKLEGTLYPRGGFLRVDTYEGHEFSYDIEGERHYIQPQDFVILCGHKEDIRVRCDVTTDSRQSSDTLNILVNPYWSPRGASRFLELVRSGYYDGVAFNRVVPNFLTQFGIGKDYSTRTKELELKIWDDFPRDIKFEPGTISFAGSGHDSRTTEIFIVMPGASQQQLDKFGENSWETPFAVIEGDVEKSALTKIYSGYGDMPPWGKGPDSKRIYDVDGYTRYLPKNFPKLDYIDRCYVTEEVGLGDFTEGEF